MTHSKTTHYICSVMFSKNPPELCHFYEQYGAIFKCIRLGNTNHYISANTNLCILKHDIFLAPETCLNGLVLYELSNNTLESATHRINDKGNLFFGRFTLPKGPFLQHTDLLFPETTPLPWVSVIRSENIDETREFYRELGSWEIEKHGDGPTHYALTHNQQIFEIYPLRKNEPSTLEFLIPTGKASPHNFISIKNQKLIS